MEDNYLYRLLADLSAGQISVDEAWSQISALQSADLGFANIDLERLRRCGAAEVIYAASKTPPQILQIAQTMEQAGQTPILLTRLAAEAATWLKDKLALQYDAVSRIGIIGTLPAPNGLGKVAVVSAGTSDIPVAEEAVKTLEFFGNDVVRIYDVGVAGLHRLLGKIAEIRSAQVIIAIAGMEGALASVLAGLTDVPVIAVPTSVGYGAAFQGITALLAMVNSCAAGVSVVNIDNGFGAAYIASRINHQEKK